MSLRGLVIISAALLLASCDGGEKARLSNPKTPYLAGGGSIESPGTSGYDPISYWDGDGVSGRPSVTIYLNEQRAYFYKGDQLVGVSQVSAGREGHDTPAGTYKIMQKDPDHASSLYGDYVDAAGNVVKKDVPGYPASHGCIRMPGKMALIFYNNVDIGTPVTIVK
jgi:hypothetical protein